MQTLSGSIGNDAVQVPRAIRFGRLAALLLFALWIGRFMRAPGGLLHGSLLIFHEAGHVVFMPFGEFLMVLGGSLFQIIVPGIFVAYFGLRRDWYALAFAGLYVAASFADVAIYIADARAGELPLLGGERSNHDWTFLLIQLNALDRDTSIGWIVARIGGSIFWCSLLVGAWFAWHGARRTTD